MLSSLITLFQNMKLSKFLFSNSNAEFYVSVAYTHFQTSSVPQAPLCVWLQSMACCKSTHLKTSWHLVDGMIIIPKWRLTCESVSPRNKCPSELLSFREFIQSIYVMYCCGNRNKIKSRCVFFPATFSLPPSPLGSRCLWRASQSLRKLQNLIVNLYYTYGHLRSICFQMVLSETARGMKIHTELNQLNLGGKRKSTRPYTKASSNTRKLKITVVCILTLINDCIWKLGAPFLCPFLKTARHLLAGKQQLGTKSNSGVTPRLSFNYWANGVSFNCRWETWYSCSVLAIVCKMLVFWYIHICYSRRLQGESEW